MDRYCRFFAPKLIRTLALCAALMVAGSASARETREEKQARVQSLRKVLIALEQGRIELAMREAPLDDAVVRSLAICVKAPLDAFKSAMKARSSEVQQILQKSGVETLAARLAGGAAQAGSAQDLEAAFGKTVEQLLAGFDMELAPSQTPELGRVRALYAEQCASCHGAKGGGDGELTKKLPGEVPNFLDDKRMRFVTPAYLFDRIQLGSPEKGMPAYAARFDSDTAWGLAHYLVGLRYGRGDKAQAKEGAAPGHLSFTELAKKDDARLLQKLDAAALKAARTTLPFAKSTPRG